ncbi:protein suppressor of white apricot-like isoform X1 [Maniola hyperantus]|uniref:protein suppressor of white apricot-like isoform X1 n=2 Tax=Aphantopus hyperantus TaxID=2795564 RepID=UPI001568F022|nr:protein suppressor of white apricot-like [Maniola hyperantus]
MSLKWTGNQSETGILRKSECKEKKEELFVFGYSCKLFRDNVKALQIDQGKHLIPWMGDETLKIDRYDARGALHDLSALEAPPGGFDWRVELTRTELDVEQLCDEERYRALHTDEDEEEMYKEEELKRLHAAGYGQVGFNYDIPAESTPEVPVEIEEPFEPSQALKDLLPINTIFADTQKQNAIIEKTANFIAHQGTQMEILIKAKQRDNPQFKFLNKDSPLNAYYTALTALVKAGKWPEKSVEVIEEKQHDMNEEYLHPSLAATVIESAPSIPSIHYKPSADCDYTLLISKMRGEATLDEAYITELAPGEVAPPGTEPLPPRANAEISRAPVMYNNNDQAVQPVVQQQYTAMYQQYMSHVQTPAVTPANTPPPQIDKKPTATKSTGLSLMKNYNTDSDSDVSDFDDSSSSDSKDNIILTPPEDVKTVIDKMAAYVARNGDEFEEIVRSKNDPRFTFLEPDNLYHPFYKRLMQEKRGVDVNGRDKEQPKQDKTPMVSFSIKKLKEPDPILPKPALPYESSSDDEETQQSETNEEAKELPKTNIPQITATNNIPPVLVYKMEAGQINNLPVVKTIEQRVSSKTARAITIPEIKEQVKETIKELPKLEENIEREEERKVEKSPEKREEKSRDREKKSPSKRKHHDRKKEYRSKEHRERRSERRSAERERKRDRESDKKRRKYKDELESEIISLEDNSDEMIDLTGDQSDSKGECETEADKTKQQERRRRAAEFLKKVGVDPAAAALPNTSLASAMVDTLESLRKKKNEQEEKRRRHEKRRRKEKREYEGEFEKHRKSKRKKNRSSEEEDSDYESSKKKKRKKDKKPSKNKKKRRREIEIEEDPPPQINIDLTNTLKELRTISPTKELGLHNIDDPPTLPQQESSSEGEMGRKKRKKDREYSEGEWSSDSDEDSVSSADK